jgi:hypothetical protein
MPESKFGGKYLPENITKSRSMAWHAKLEPEEVSKNNKEEVDLQSMQGCLPELRMDLTLRELRTQKRPRQGGTETVAIGKQKLRCCF